MRNKLIEWLAGDALDEAYEAGRREFKVRAIRMMKNAEREDLEDSKNPKIRKAERERCLTSSQSFGQAVVILEKIS